MYFIEIQYSREIYLRVSRFEILGLIGLVSEIPVVHGVTHRSNKRSMPHSHLHVPRRMLPERPGDKCATKVVHLIWHLKSFH